MDAADFRLLQPRSGA